MSTTGKPIVSANCAAPLAELATRFAGIPAPFGDCEVRLARLDRALTDIVLQYQPDCAAVEEVFVNTNGQSTLKLGQARGVCLLAAARGGLPVAEYATRLVKKAVVGTGGAEKAQVQAMLKILLPGVKLEQTDDQTTIACDGHVEGRVALSDLIELLPNQRFLLHGRHRRRTHVGRGRQADQGSAGAIDVDEAFLGIGECDEIAGVFEHEAEPDLADD